MRNLNKLQAKMMSDAKIRQCIELHDSIERVTVRCDRKTWVLPEKAKFISEEHSQTKHRIHREIYQSHESRFSEPFLSK